MKVICLRKSISRGPIKLVRDQVSDSVPDAIAREWIAAGYVREVPALEAAAPAPAVAEPVKPSRKPRA